jgi:hypothetical protein
MPPSPLPIEVLAAIICQCTSVANVVQVSRRFAAIAYSISHLWSFVRLGPRQFTQDGLHHLATRLHRVSNTPLDLIIGPVSSQNETILIQLCAIITNVINAQSGQSITVRELQIMAQTSRMAEITFCAIPIDGIWLLSVSVDSITTCNDAQSLDSCLSEAFESDKLLLLEELSLSGCLPNGVQDVTMPYLASLQTLVFDESKTEFSHHPFLEALFLHASPELHTISIRQAAAYDDDEEPEHLDLPKIYLANLSRLELTTGLACQLLPVLKAVKLEELVLDGAFAGEDEDVSALIDALQQVSFPNLHHLTLASNNLNEQAWEWLFFQGPPFPNLEHISLIGIGEPGGFNSTLLHRHAQELVLPLRHLTLLQCQLELDGGALVHVFTATMQQHAACVMEYDGSLGLGKETEQELCNLGVQLQQLVY